jgi:hypothetical protein
VYQRRDFYRHARYVHGWLSAFAFLVLIFFALTGLFLNNPDWFKSSAQEQTHQISIPHEMLEKFSIRKIPVWRYWITFVKSKVLLDVIAAVKC